ncbi:MAG: ribosome biogenesis GTPase Der [Actinomycetota bacterium]
MTASVAIFGRQNVGKSTLVNRLVGGREAIADAAPGVTRDRVERDVEWNGRRFRLVDTGGVRAHAKGIEELVARQAERALEEADLVLFLVDGRAGATEEDLSLARRLRRLRAPVLAVVNKVDTEADERAVEAFLRLGLGEPATVSALHGRGSGDLLDRILDLLPPEEPARDEDAMPAFALVGRPNVGKSSLFNRLVGEERSVVFEQAGTTRDAVDATVAWASGPVRFVDTAGLRRTSTSRGVDYYSFLRAERAIERADVALLVLDATDGFTTEDKRIAARVLEFGRALLVVGNKWDLVEEKERAFGALRQGAARFAGAAVLRTSARTGSGVTRVEPALLGLNARYGSRATTAVVNRVLLRAQDERPGPVRYRYASQVSAAPPTFAVFGGRAPGATYERFLEGRIREALHLEGVPIRLRFRPKGGRRPARG